MRRILCLLLAAAVLPLAGIAEAAHGGHRSHAGAPKRHPLFVAAANPLAAEAGMRVLKAGGSAVDAAVAIQAVLGLVEPQSSGLGGGAFMTYRDAATGKITIYNGREAAPQAADASWFTGIDGKTLDFFNAVLSGRSTGVPGAVAMLGVAQAEHGKLKWADLFGDAETLARDGFIVSPRLAHFFVNPKFPEINAPDVKAYFTRPGGGFVQAGDRLKNPAYAQTLKVLAEKGPRALLTGKIAEDIVARVGEGPNPSPMLLTDLAGYQPKKDAPVCASYRVVYMVCAPAPPSSGISLLQALKLLERFDLSKETPDSPRYWLLLAEAEELMYADRDRYVGDPAFVAVPVKGFLDPGYVAERAKLMDPEHFFSTPPSPGTPPGAPERAPDKTQEAHGTSHFVIIDAAGNVVSMTTTVESIFGSGRMVDGFFLNNQLTDFYLAGHEPGGQLAANAPAGGKRPRSSMSPVILLTKDGQFLGAVGSPGGSSILSYDLKTITAVLDLKLSMQQATALPNLVAYGPRIGADTDKFDAKLVAALAAEGLALRPGTSEESGIQGVIVKDGKYDGGADPRREGVVLTAE